MKCVAFVAYHMFLLTMRHVCSSVYLHNPRGSNNRLNEDLRERRNAYRIFDSQNNDRGGYNVGSLYYYGTSVLQVEWTNQHSCHSANSHCELILQYMCGDLVRDGTALVTIPEYRAACGSNYNCTADRRYGMHESYDYYMMCKTRQRNQGLFTADQNLYYGYTAKYTRQNPAGGRRGYECPEERDYYPYWHHSPWVDIALMTNNVSRCQYYQTESQNVKERWACVLPFDVIETNFYRNLVLPNNKQDCEAFYWPPGYKNGNKAQWVRYPSHGVDPPDCQETEFTRVNHLGNGLGGQPNVYNWTIPNIDRDSCVLRIRYNVSTNDYDGWSTSANDNADKSRLQDGSKVSLAEKYGFASDAAARNRGYILKNNPEVKLFQDAFFALRLAVNTAQYGRVFQDRSHTFSIRARPVKTNGTIHNLNVRGKRGNIVQVYPAVEYDFVPNTLEMTLDDSIHIQWTGSDTNPRNNEGQGLHGRDRNNLLLLQSQQYPEGSGLQFGPGGKYGHYGVNYPMALSNVTLIGLSQVDLENLAFLSQDLQTSNNSQLDMAGSYFDLGLRAVTGPAGTYHYMCTRNNDFSNRDQKGRIVVNAHPVAQKAIGATGGELSLTDGSFTVIVKPGTFENLQKMRLEQLTTELAESRGKTEFQRKLSEKGQFCSHLYLLTPENITATSGHNLTIHLKINASAEICVYRSASNIINWTRVPDVHVTDGEVEFQTSQGGLYVAATCRRKPLHATTAHIGAIVGINAAGLLITASVIAGIFYCRRHHQGKYHTAYYRRTDPLIEIYNPAEK